MTTSDPIQTDSFQEILRQKEDTLLPPSLPSPPQEAQAPKEPPEIPIEDSDAYESPDSPKNVEQINRDSEERSAHEASIDPSTLLISAAAEEPDSAGQPDLGEADSGQSAPASEPESGDQSESSSEKPASHSFGYLQKLNSTDPSSASSFTSNKETYAKLFGYTKIEDRKSKPEKPALTLVAYFEKFKKLDRISPKNDQILAKILVLFFFLFAYLVAELAASSQKS